MNWKTQIRSVKFMVPTTIAIQILGTLLFPRIACCQTKKDAARLTDSPDFMKAVLVMDKITRVDDGYQSIDRNNSRVIIRSSSINSIVAKGSEMLPVLISITRTDGIEFDTFARCYSACDQIIRKKNEDLITTWYGGCGIENTSTDVMRITKGGQKDEKKFRLDVIESIELNARKVSKQKRLVLARVAPARNNATNSS